MTKPRRYGGKSHPATPTQEQTRPISTETSNLDKKIRHFWCLLQKRALKKKTSCKLMTKPRRYGGKSHPATPTQEQTRPISTETSNLYKNTLFLMSPAKTSLKKNVASLWPNRAGMVENLIPRRQLRSKRDQYRRKLAIYTKIYCFWYLLQKRALKTKTLQAYDQTAQVWWKISSRDANSGANETNIDGN